MAIDELVLGSSQLLHNLSNEEAIFNEGVDYSSLIRLVVGCKDSVVWRDNFEASRAFLLTLLSGSRGLSPQNSNGYFVRFESGLKGKKYKIIVKTISGQSNRLQIFVEYSNIKNLKEYAAEVQLRCVQIFLSEKEIIEFMNANDLSQVDLGDVQAIIERELGVFDGKFEGENAKNYLTKALQLGKFPRRIFIFTVGYFKTEEGNKFRIFDSEKFDQYRLLNQILISRALDFEIGDEELFYDSLFGRYGLEFRSQSFLEPHYEKLSTTSGNDTAANESPTFKIFFGPPGTGKTRLAKSKIRDLHPNNFKIVQIHPSSSYEEMVEGIRPVTFSDGELKYEVVDGPIKIMANKAQGKMFITLARLSEKDEHLVVELPSGTAFRYGLEKCQIKLQPTDEPITVDSPNGDTFSIKYDHLSKSQRNIFGSLPRFQRIEVSDLSWGKNQNYLLLLDELNRGSVASILGEMLYVIGEVESEIHERRPVALQYSHELFIWPDNLSLYGTMNSTDISIDKLDQAIKRRFEFEEVEPDYSVFDQRNGPPNQRIFSFLDSNISINEYFENNEIGLKPSIILRNINDALLEKASEKSAFNIRDKLIGQSYFIKFSRRVILLDKAGIPYGKKRNIAFGNVLRDVLVKDIKPALLNIFNGDRLSMESFLTDHLSQWEENFGYAHNVGLTQSSEDAA